MRTINGFDSERWCLHDIVAGELHQSWGTAEGKKRQILSEYVCAGSGAPLRSQCSAYYGFWGIPESPVRNCGTHARTSTTVWQALREGAREVFQVIQDRQKVTRWKYGGMR